jgi:hypothetical protein
MIKALMSLIAVLASFFGVLGLNNSSALATPIVDRNHKPIVSSYLSSSLEEPVNLNFSGSLWQLNKQDANNIFDRLGCSCGVCVRQEASNS